MPTVQIMTFTLLPTVFGSLLRVAKKTTIKKFFVSTKMALMSRDILHANIHNVCTRHMQILMAYACLHVAVPSVVEKVTVTALSAGLLRTAVMDASFPSVTV
jgi:hypothetical protein